MSKKETTPAVQPEKEAPVISKFNPEMQITLGGHKFPLKGTMGFLEAIEQEYGGIIKLFHTFARGEASVDILVMILREGIRGGGTEPPSDPILKSLIMSEGFVTCHFVLQTFFQSAVAGDPDQKGKGKK